MIQLNDEAAIKFAFDIVKAICSNPNTHIVPNKQSAEDLADFISTLETKFLTSDEEQ